jgi:hypothetical protein
MYHLSYGYTITGYVVELFFIFEPNIVSLYLLWIEWWKQYRYLSRNVKNITKVLYCINAADEKFSGNKYYVVHKINTFDKPYNPAVTQHLEPTLTIGIIHMLN